MRFQIGSRVVWYPKLKQDKKRKESVDNYHTIELHSNDANLSGKISYLIIVIAPGTQNREVGDAHFSSILLYCLDFYHTCILSIQVNHFFILREKEGIITVPEEWCIIVPIFKSSNLAKLINFNYAFLHFLVFFMYIIIWSTRNESLIYLSNFGTLIHFIHFDLFQWPGALV